MIDRNIIDCIIFGANALRKCLSNICCFVFVNDKYYSCDVNCIGNDCENDECK